jgi:protein-S-isoprenylcysteine O-methyltransferase Ste14
LIIIALIILDIILLEGKNDLNKIDYFWIVICFAISIFGEAIRFYTNGTAPPGTSGRATKIIKTDQLNKSGMYSIVRHPLYLANFFIWLGASLFFKRWYISIVVILIFIIYYKMIIFYEEGYLRSKFAEEYDEYSKIVNAVVANFRNYIKPSAKFKIAAAIRKEHDSIFAIVAIFYLFHSVWLYKVNNFGFIKMTTIDMIFIIIVFLWISLKVMKLSGFFKNL